MIALTVQQLSKITGLDSDELEKLLKGEDGEPLENAPAIVVEKVSERIGKTKETEFNRAFQKLAKKLEGIAKTAGIEEYTDVEDAVRQLADKASEAGQGGESTNLETLTPSQLTKIPAFKEYKAGRDAEMEALKADYETKIKSQRALSTISEAKKRALTLLADKNAKFNNQERQLDGLFKIISGNYSLDMDEKGQIIVLSADGEPAIDKSHNPIKFEDLIVEEWEPLFGFNETDPNKKTPAPKPGTFGKTEKQTTGIKFDSIAAANKAIAMETDAAKRLELRKAMNEQFSTE